MKNNYSEPTRFGSLNIGDLFIYGGCIHEKVDETTTESKWGTKTFHDQDVVIQ